MPPIQASVASDRKRIIREAETVRRPNGIPSGLVARRVAGIDWVLSASTQYLAPAGLPDTPEQLRQRDCLFSWRNPANDGWTRAQGETTQCLPSVGSWLYVFGFGTADAFR